MKIKNERKRIKMNDEYILNVLSGKLNISRIVNVANFVNALCHKSLLTKTN